MNSGEIEKKLFRLNAFHTKKNKTIHDCQSFTADSVYIQQNIEYINGSAQCCITYRNQTSFALLFALQIKRLVFVINTTRAEMG